MSASRVVLVSVVTALALRPFPSSAEPGPVPTPNLPPLVGPRPVPTVPVPPRIVDFSFIGAVVNCADPGPPRPLLRYRVIGGTGGLHGVFITPRLEPPVAVTGYDWFGPLVGGVRPAEHSDPGVVLSGQGLAGRLTGWTLEALGDRTRATRTLSVRYRPPMTLSMRGARITKTVLSSDGRGGGRIRYGVDVEYLGLTNASVQIRYASPGAVGRTGEPTVTGTFDPAVPPTGDYRSDTRMEARLSWVLSWAPHSEAFIAAPKQYLISGRQTGPCGERYSPMLTVPGE